MRVLPDRHHIVPRDFRIFSTDSETIVYERNTDWQFILDDLAARGIHSLLVEGGRIWLETIIASGLWDEMHVEVAPVRIGSGVSAPRINFPVAEESQVAGHCLYTLMHI